MTTTPTVTDAPPFDLDAVLAALADANWTCDGYADIETADHLVGVWVTRYHDAVEVTIDHDGDLYGPYDWDAT